ncbi:MAG: hypothetical protein L0H25_08245 [Micrococcales bacterium]|nr:hypothetical protein [Micrococcales bacterium]
MRPADHRDIAFAREKAKRTLPISLFVLLGVIAMYLPLPRRFVAVLPLALAIVLSVRLLQYLRGRPGRDKVWPILTLVLIGFIVVTLGLQGIFYRSLLAYQECLASAQTQQAAAACEPLRQQSPLGGTFAVN